jgi:pimeloyl-ACP methyl ester carboxylesterase
MEKADLGDKIIEYEARGVGEPLILIHGSVLADSLMPLINEHALLSAIQEFWSTFSREQAARILCPTFAVVGTASELPLREGHQLLQEWFPQIELLEVTGGNHLFPVTKARQVAEGLTGFLKRHPMT